MNPLDLPPRCRALFDRLPPCPYVQTTWRDLQVLKAEHLDGLLDALAMKAADDPDVVDERLPYWAELWPAALALADAVWSAPSLPHAQCLELGCGPGLPGLVAARRGCAVHLTDYLPEALTLAELNAHLNGLPFVRTHLLDWRVPDPALRSPWILASDVAYEARNFAPLLACFDTLLLPGGEIWFSEPGRPIAQAFFSALRNAGWNVADGPGVFRLSRCRN